LSAQKNSQPIERQWHIPYIQNDELGLSLEAQRKIGVARCARVSYLTHDGTRDYNKDLGLFERLLTGSGKGHWSPMEHVANACRDANQRSGNFIGWFQYRKCFPEECQ
jgi:hypothetical protein